jgi:hypothetical protein
MEFVLSDASLLLPPTGTPLTGIEFPKRLPCGEVERARHSIRTFFRLRQLSLEVQGKPETQLPLSNPDSCIQVQDVLDLSKSWFDGFVLLLNQTMLFSPPPIQKQMETFKRAHAYQIMRWARDFTFLLFNKFF